MISLENPPSFVVHTEAEKAAFDNGFRIEKTSEAGWMRFASTTAQGEILIAAASKNGPWLLSVTHAGVAAEINHERRFSTAEGPGAATFIFKAQPELYAAIERAYQLGASLPDAPLQRFRKETESLPRKTEAERLVIQRVGQNLFRTALMEYWGGCCPLTGIAEPALLRASHIVPWSDCDSDSHRLDVYNGLLLSALWDAAFDKGLVSFSDDGETLVSPALSAPARDALRLETPRRLSRLMAPHKANLSRHRASHGF